MKKKTKLGLGIASLAVGVLALSGCTSSFCSTTDKAHMLTAYDNGVCKFYNADDTSKPTEECYELIADGVSNIYFTYSFANNNGGLTKTNEAAKSNNITYVKGKPEFWAAFDLVIIEKSIAASGSTDINSVEKLNTLLDEYKHLRFDSSSEDDKLWDNWQTYFDAAVTKMIKCGEEGKYDISYDISKVPSSDYVALYKTTMESAIANYRGCITTKTGFFGNFGWNTDKTEVQIEAKSYQYGWSKGFFEGLLVYPIGALIDVMCSSFASLGNGLNGTNGWAQLLTIVLVTLIVRAFIFAVSFKSTINNARMTELQPQLAKIQAKYPNANTNQNEKARMADEMNKLYKKNHINPFSSILVMIIQFPVFICVWGALIGSGWLSTGQFLGMNFADSISSILFNASNWQTGAAWTALVLFLLMAIAQVVSMLLPQWMQKAKQKKVAKLGKNPAQTQQNRTMKIVTYVMMIMIIFMGFSLASAMGVYWFIGAIISIIQTLVTQAIIARQSKEKK